jgi:WD40 repeat protein
LGEKWFVVVDSRPGEECDGISDGTPVFSPDGTRVAYGAQTTQSWLWWRTAWTVVMNGKAGPEYDDLGEDTSVVFSSDGKHVAYAAQKGSKWVAVLDGQAGPEYDRVGGLAFSPDGGHLAYAAKDGPKSLVVLDAQTGPSCDGIICGGPTFNDDGSLEYLAIKDNSLYRVKCTPAK